MKSELDMESEIEREQSLMEFEKKMAEMYADMQSPKHRQATEAFFSATAEDLNSAYRENFESQNQK